MKYKAWAFIEIDDNGERYDLEPLFALTFWEEDVVVVLDTIRDALLEVNAAKFYIEDIERMIEKERQKGDSNNE